MVTLVAFVVFHVRVEDWPARIEVGDAVRVAVGATGPAAAIGHVRPLTIPVLVAAVQPVGGLGRTDVVLW